MNTFYSDKIATVYYEETIDCLFLKYLDKVPDNDAFVKINTVVLEAFQKLNTRNFVADIRKMGIISLASQQWVVNTLLPGMVKHLNGKMLYHAQLLDPAEILSKVSGSNIRSKSNQVADGFEIEQFLSEEELMKNLQQRKLTE